MGIRIRTAALGAALAAAASAQAATVVQTQAFDAGNPIVVHPTATRTWTERSANDTTLAFAGFDPALGTLTGVSLSFTGAQDFTVGGSIVIPDGAAQATTRAFGSYFTVVALAGHELESFTSRPLGPVDCRPADGVCLAQASEHHDEAFDAALPDLAPFRTGGPVDLDLTSHLDLFPFVTVSGGAPAPVITVLSALEWSGQASLTYAYDPAAIAPPASVPEPAAWTLMLVGFAGLGAALRAGRARAAVG